MLQQEELLWFQRSREEWIKSKDRNTKFYHASTSIRKSKNKIGTLKNNDGDWISDPLALENMVLTFYKKLSRGNKARENLNFLKKGKM